MKTIVRNLKKLITKAIKITILISTTTIGFFTIFISLFSNWDLLNPEVAFVGAILATLFSEICFIGCIAD